MKRGTSPRGRCHAADDDGVVLLVRVTTRASRDGVDGVGVLSDGRAVAHVRVRAAAVEGKANAALIGLLSKRLKRPKSQIRLISGATSRLKKYRIEGEPAELAASIEAWPKT